MYNYWNSKIAELENTKYFPLNFDSQYIVASNIKK